jgi:4-amino-4-deoxy-L-arabinose transferase-like glycosyltransferase
MFLGGLLVLAGIVVPSASLIQFLRASPDGLGAELLVGAGLFRLGLVLLGLLVLAASRLPVWAGENAGETNADSGSRKALPILGAILIVATALRLYALNAGLWYDEILTYVNYVKLPLGEIVSTYDSQNQHLLYTVLAHISVGVFGESAWALRLPAVLFGVGSIWALYLLGRQLGSAREGVLAAALLAFSYHHIWFSQNARGYTGLLFWTILSSYLFLRAFRGGPRIIWPLYAGAAALGVYTHLTMIFVIGVHLVIYLGRLLQRPGDPWGRWAVGALLGFGLAGLLVFQLHALVIPQIMHGMGEESTVVAWKNPLWTVLELTKGMQVSFAGGGVAVAAIVLVGAGLVGFARSDPAVIPLFLAPAAACAAVVVGMGHHLWPRFFFFSMGFGALIVVRGTSVLGGVVARRLASLPLAQFAVGTVVALGVVGAAAISIPAVYAPKQDFGGALAFVQERRETGDAVVTVGLATFPYKNFYKVDWQAVDSVDGLNAVRARARRTWLLYTLPLHVQSVFPDIMAVVRDDFRLVKYFYGSVGGGTIFVYRSDGSPSRLSASRLGAGSWTER